jgi:hypothetical protein
VTDDTTSLKEFLREKIIQRKKRIHSEHSPRFNHYMQLEIDCYEWVLGKIEVNKIPNERIESVIRATIKDLEKRKEKSLLVWFYYCLFATGIDDWTAVSPIVANSFAV